MGGIMHYERVHLGDWHRLLLGDLPWTFLLEVVARASFIYILVMFAMRGLGKRVAAQLTVFELSIVVALAATVGVPLEAANKGLLPPVIILVVVIIMQRILSELAFRHHRFDWASSGDVIALMRDGKLLLGCMKKSGLSRERLFAVLRAARIEHLGQIRAMYLEASGAFTLVRAEPPVPGLSILPGFETTLRQEARTHHRFVCASCGALDTQSSRPRSACQACSGTAWTEASGDLTR